MYLVMMNDVVYMCIVANRVLYVYNFVIVVYIHTLSLSLSLPPTHINTIVYLFPLTIIKYSISYIVK